MTCGWAGMTSACIANSQGQQKLRTLRVKAQLFQPAFKGGSVMGFSVASLGILGVSGAFAIYFALNAVERY